MSWSNYKILFIIWEYQISRVDTVKKSKADHLGLEHNLHSDKLDILNLNDGLPDERYRRQKIILSTVFWNWPPINRSM